MEKNKIGASYLTHLQALYHEIDKRGILVSKERLEHARISIDNQISTNLSTIKAAWGCHVYVGAFNDDGSEGSVNLNASSGKRTPLLKLQSLGYKVPSVSKRNEDTGEYESKESLAELSLQKMFAANQFSILGGDPVIKSLLAIRELVTLKNRYVNANLLNREGLDYFLSNYNVTGTTTGRRSSKKHVFGFGANSQNFPKHGRLAEIYRRCLIAHPGMLFLSVDQMQAEDWPVSALAMNYAALNELETGVDRHKLLACKIFNLQENSYDADGWKKSIERFLGKKVRHANNYDMQEVTFSDSLAKEGKPITPKQCRVILDLVNKIDPSVKGVFHANIQQQLYKDRTLRTPFGRERQFFGLRAGDNSGNNKIFREAYAYIPQSTVGDNTGFAVYEIESAPAERDSRGVIQESHDSIIQEINAVADTIWKYVQKTIKAFDRRITFDNGISFKIPVEGEIGYDLFHTETLISSKTGSKKLEDISYKDVQIALLRLNEYKGKEMELKPDAEIKEELHTGV